MAGFAINPPWRPLLSSSLSLLPAAQPGGSPEHVPVRDSTTRNDEGSTACLYIPATVVGPGTEGDSLLTHLPKQPEGSRSHTVLTDQKLTLSVTSVE